MSKRNGMLTSAVVAAFLTTCAPALAETLVENSVEQRTVLGFRIQEQTIQKLLPDSWQVAPAPQGPLKDVTVFVVLVDKLFVADGAGKPTPNETGKNLVVAVPSKGPGGAAGYVIVSGYTGAPARPPGVYKVFEPAEVSLTRSMNFKTAEETIDDAWMVKGQQDQADIRFTYPRQIPNRAVVEQKIVSGAEPTIQRRYRIDLCTKRRAERGQSKQLPNQSVRQTWQHSRFGTTDLNWHPAMVRQTVVYAIVSARNAATSSQGAKQVLNQMSASLPVP